MRAFRFTNEQIIQLRLAIGERINGLNARKEFLDGGLRSDIVNWISILENINKKLYS